MYKKVLKNIKGDLNKREDFYTNLWKNSDKKHAIHDKLPHFIFSVENPIHPSKFKISHDQALALLKEKGYNAESMSGKYGEPEKSILVHNPPKLSYKHLNRFASALGQDSTIISDGYDHEMHYVNGPKAGKHHKGEGTVFHKEEPNDYYSTLEDGTHFTHGFNFDKLHSDSKFLKNMPGKMKKSENFIKNGKFLLKKAEDKEHKLASAGPGTKLIHYSPHEGLRQLHPDYHGVRRIGSEAKQGAPTHRMTFYYAEGVEPESVVTSGSKKKYVVDLGSKKLYDIAKDPHGLREKAYETAKKVADQRQINPGLVRDDEMKDAYHQEIKNAGFHGIYNSNLDDTMSHVVGMFSPMTPEAEHRLHPADFEKTSAKNYHAIDASKDHAQNFAEEHGHHNFEFLHNAKEKFGQ